MRSRPTSGGLGELAVAQSSVKTAPLAQVVPTRLLVPHQSVREVAQCQPAAEAGATEAQSELARLRDRLPSALFPSWKRVEPWLWSA